MGAARALAPSAKPRTGERARSTTPTHRARHGFGLDPGSRQRDVTELQRTAGNQAVQRAVGGMLSVGSRGPQVVALQQALNACGAGLTADGAFGPATRAALVAFQRSHGLAADGIAGPKTFGALGRGGGPGPAAPAGLPPRLKAKLELVRQALGARLSTDHAVGEESVCAGTTSVQRDFFDDVSDAASDAAGSVVDAAGEAYDAASETAGEVYDAASETAGEVYDAASETAGEVYDAASDTAGDIADAVTGVASTVVDGVTDAAGAVVDTVSGVVDTVTGIAGQAVDAGQQAVDSAITEVADAMGQVDAGVRALLGPIVDQLGDALRDLGRGIGVVDVAGLEALVDRFLAGFDPAQLVNAGAVTGSTTFNPSSGSKKVTGTFEQAANVLAGQSEAGSVATGHESDLVTLEVGTVKTVVAAKVTVNQVITLPEWTDRVDNADADLDNKQKAEWNRFAGAISAHETTHVDKDKAAYKNVHAGMAGKLVPAADAVLEAAGKKATADNAAFDAATEHGKTAAKSTRLETNFGQVIKVP